MMMVAADLLETHQVRHGDDNDQNEFDGWLDGYRLTRPDGWWLADRRDPRPFVDPPTLDYKQRATWRWEVNRAYLDAQLSTDQGNPVVWGHWEGRQDDQRETVSVGSALVARETAESLLVALQTAEDPGRFVLPEANERDDIAVGAFRCSGWICDSGRDQKLDEYDSWSEKLHFPDPVPSEAVIAALSLVRDADGRTWRDGVDGLLGVESWTQHVGYGREADVENGWRLSANRAFLEHLFRVWPDQCLILSVRVRRYGGGYASDKSDFEEYAWPYQLYYLMGPDGVARPF